MKLGFSLSSEEFEAPTLVSQAERAETAAGISDHFRHWVDAQGNSPFVWCVRCRPRSRSSSTPATTTSRSTGSAGTKTAFWISTSGRSRRTSTSPTWAGYLTAWTPPDTAC
ncbi:MAG TPA: hypothetical protein VHZ54_06295 [Solirubrobacterales bacterium]|nr:hypothetical protein [Solirubrobacterales bacterium]